MHTVDIMNKPPLLVIVQMHCRDASLQLVLFAWITTRDMGEIVLGRTYKCIFQNCIFCPWKYICICDREGSRALHHPQMLRLHRGPQHSTTHTTNKQQTAI